VKGIATWKEEKTFDFLRTKLGNVDEACEHTTLLLRKFLLYYKYKNKDIN